jgi:hypothetical protein
MVLEIEPVSRLSKSTAALGGDRHQLVLVEEAVRKSLTSAVLNFSVGELLFPEQEAQTKRASQVFVPCQNIQFSD